MNPTLPIPAGLTDSNGEFFTKNYDDAFLIKDSRVIEFENFDADLLTSIESHFKKCPVKMLNIPKLTGTHDRLTNLKRLLICNFGKLDNVPDLVEGRLQAPEYCICPKRGTCNFDGKICDPLTTDQGEKLTKREVKIIELTAAGESNKGMAHTLNRSINTITTHTRNVRRKTGLYRKADITRFAYQKQLAI